MTTQEAFKHLTDKRGWYKQVGIPAATAQSLKRHYKAGKMSDRRVKELLKAAGYKEVPSSWRL